ncbi:MAG: 7-carboxy-7-deazaguanine synthase [Deferribacteres bacterium]|jgi:organic radical activating enzyme|nr:hypothetical protein [Deferribacteraceae bacterium]MDK2791852.1 7-carboxy-7-deazaguanine synthase [Deferribacteres bacterium]
MQLQNTLNNINISEAFISFQGEGKYIGARQLFIRFSGCDVNCQGCDTDYSSKESFIFFDKIYYNPVNIFQFVEDIKGYDIFNEIHSISFTGGEPLLSLEAIKFMISSFGKKTKYFLETSGYHLDILKEIYDLLDIVSIDIKLKSTFGVDDNIYALKNAYFIEKNKSYFKLIVDNKIEQFEIANVVDLLKSKGFDEIYLHTKNNLVEFKLLSDIMKIFYGSGINCFFVPQMHKLVGIR